MMQYCLERWAKKRNLTIISILAIAVLLGLPKNQSNAQEPSIEEIELYDIMENAVERLKNEEISEETRIGLEKKFTRLLEESRTGDPDSQYQLARHYLFGWGCEKDEAQALHWFEKAAFQDHIDAAVKLCCSLWFKLPPEKAFKWTAIAAGKGAATAQTHLGLYYSQGSRVTEQDHLEAVKWYKKAAYQKQGIAMEELAKHYAQGLGVEQNLVKAYAWYDLAGTELFNTAFPMIKKRMDKLEKTMTSEQSKAAKELSKKLHNEIYRNSDPQ